MPSDRSPRLMGRHVVPPSSVRNAPAAEIATKIRPALVGIQHDRVQAQPAGARRPRRPGAVRAQARQFVPRLPAVGGAEQRRVFDTGVDRIGIGQRRLEVPDALELPRVRRAVVPLVRARLAVVGELVADRLPCLAAVVGSLDELPEPARGLRRVQPVRVDRRALHVVDLPAPEVRAADVPLAALGIRRQDERALACSHQHPYSAHRSLLVVNAPTFSGIVVRARLSRKHPQIHDITQMDEVARTRASLRSATRGGPATAEPAHRRVARSVRRGDAG